MNWSETTVIALAMILIQKLLSSLHCIKVARNLKRDKPLN